MRLPQTNPLITGIALQDSDSPQHVRENLSADFISRRGKLSGVVS
jgi:hypothetical protein